MAYKSAGHHTVTLTDDAYAVVCGMVHGSEDVNQDGVFGPWDEVREHFPLDYFFKRAKDPSSEVEYHPGAGF